MTQAKLASGSRTRMSGPGKGLARGFLGAVLDVRWWLGPNAYIRDSKDMKLARMKPVALC